MMNKNQREINVCVNNIYTELSKAVGIPKKYLNKKTTMKNENENIIDIINELNQELYDVFGDDYIYDRQFTYLTDGYSNIIQFGEILIWNTEDDEREWDYENNNYEPLKTFLKRQLKKEIERLIEIKENFIIMERETHSSRSVDGR